MQHFLFIHQIPSIFYPFVPSRVFLKFSLLCQCTSPIKSRIPQRNWQGTSWDDIAWYADHPSLNQQFPHCKIKKNIKHYFRIMMLVPTVSCNISTAFLFFSLMLSKCAIFYACWTSRLIHAKIIMFVSSSVWCWKCLTEQSTL